jgi:hypothetical protein
MYESGSNPTEGILRHLTGIPLSDELVPGVEPGAMPFLYKLHEQQRQQLDGEYRSPTLLNSLEPSREILSFTREAALYLDAMNPLDRERATAVASLLRDVPPSRVGVCMPVASHEEGDNLYRVLTHYPGQTLPQDIHEIYLLLNRPANNMEGRPTDDVETKRALHRFHLANPSARNVNTADVVFESPLNLGEVKKVHFDSFIIRCLEAGIEDPIIVMNDADMVHVDEEYLAKYVSYFDQSPLVDAVVGEFDLDHGAYVSSPFVHVAYRAHMLVSALKGNSVKRIVNSNNSAMRASAYCALGGNTKMRRTSDAYMGVALTGLRGSNQTILRPQDPEITIQTSARRVMAAWQKGYAPNEKWRLNLGAHNADIRKLPDGLTSTEELFDLDDVATFDSTLSYILNRLIANYEREDDDPRGWDSPIYRQAFSYLGLEYSLSTDNTGNPYLQFGDTTNLRRGLYAFRQNYLFKKQPH